jgi:hypothetical protein
MKAQAETDFLSPDTIIEFPVRGYSLSTSGNPPLIRLLKKSDQFRAKNVTEKHDWRFL